MSRDLFSVEGKTALVTGGSRGIGLMIARGYVEAGAKTYISSRKADACADAVAELNGLGGAEAIAIPADLSQEAEAIRLANEIAEREGALHILVNNAGANWGAPLEEFPDAAWHRCLDLNVISVFHLTRYLVPTLREAARPGDPARVINIGSIDGLRVPELDTWAYSSSKAAVHHLTRTLARRLAREGINVNAIAPGPFESKMMEATLDAFGDMIKASNPMRRIGEPDDMAGAAIFFASRAGAYCTGTVLPVDGGMSTTT